MGGQSHQRHQTLWSTGPSLGNAPTDPGSALEQDAQIASCVLSFHCPSHLPAKSQG